MESILTGSQCKGAAGENILDVFFAKLPAEWQVRNFAVGSNIVEFGIRLPDGLVLPIDSKWAATAVHQEFLNASEGKDKAAKKQQLQATVARRAGEIRKYIDPNLTASFAIAVVPDPIFELCPELMPDLLQQNVLLLSHSLFMPYLLLVFHNTLKTLKTVDLKRLDGYLTTAQTSITSLQSELEGRFSRALVMLENSRQDMAAQLASLSGGMVALQVGSSALKPEALPEPEAETFKLAAPQ